MFKLINRIKRALNNKNQKSNGLTKENTNEIKSLKFLYTIKFIMTLFGLSISVYSFVFLYNKTLNNTNYGQEGVIFFIFIGLYTLGRIVTGYSRDYFYKKYNLKLRKIDLWIIAIFIICYLVLGAFHQKSDIFGKLPTMFTALSFFVLSLDLIIILIKSFYFKNDYCKKCKIKNIKVAEMKVEVAEYYSGMSKVGEAVSSKTGETFNVYQSHDSESTVIKDANLYQCPNCKVNYEHYALNNHALRSELWNYKIVEINKKTTREKITVLEKLLKDEKIDIHTYNKLKEKLSLI